MKPEKDKVYEIIVNARKVQIDHKMVTFEEIVTIAFGSYSPSETVIYTVTFSKGEHGHEGSLVAGKKVRVKDGMVFNVKQTNKS